VPSVDHPASRPVYTASMGGRIAVAFLLISAGLVAQGTTPKAKVEDYSVRGGAGKIALGAEYMVRSIQGGGTTLIAADYLVIEVAVYPPRFEPIPVSSGQFTLRINGRKQVLFNQSPGMVSASIKYADWERRPTLVGGVGGRDGGIIVGQPPTTGRFPGDPRPDQTRLPRPPKAPDQNPSGVEPKEPIDADQLVAANALPEGEATGPVSGYVFFAYKGKTRKIKSLELLYKGPAGEATLKLF
jgi:hypothetical protein